MKEINLISQSGFIKEAHFSVERYCGKETAVFITTEQEFINRSVNFRLYDSKFAPLPQQVVTVSTGIERRFYCSDDFYIVTDKGTIGFDSSLFVSHVTVKETADQFIITVSLVENEETAAKVIEAYSANDVTLPFVMRDNYISKLTYYGASVVALSKKIEQTPFLDCDEHDYIMPVLLGNNANYMCHSAPFKFKSIKSSATPEIGAYMYDDSVDNALEIVKITGFAHTVYGQFYATLRTEYVYPQDAQAISDMFPVLYQTYCMSNAEKRLAAIEARSEAVSYIKTDCIIGDPVIYQEVFIVNGFYGVASGLFHLMISGQESFGDYPDMTEPFLRLEVDTSVATLLSVDGRFKLMLYKCVGIVRHDGKRYWKFTFLDETEFFTDFTKDGCRTVKKHNHQCALKGIEYLLYNGRIKPTTMTQQQYASLPCKA